MGVILDAWKSWKDPSANRLLFGEAKKKHTRYMDLRTRFKRQPLTVAERKVVETADRRSEMYNMPLEILAYGPVNVWLLYFKREAQNRFLRMVARQPFRVLVMYTIPAIALNVYARAHILDKFFTRDSGIVKLAEKYRRDDCGEGAKNDEAPDGFIYGIDRSSEGVTSDRLTNDSLFGEANKKGVIHDATEAFTVSETKIFSFGEAKKKHADYMDLRAQLKRQPLTDAERNVVDAAGGRCALYILPTTIATFGASSVWAYNRFVRKVKNRFLRMVAAQPLRVHAMYAIPAGVVWYYVCAEVTDKFFTRDSGIVQLAQKYPPVVSSEGVKRDEAPDDLIYGMDRISEGVTSRGTTAA